MGSVGGRKAAGLSPELLAWGKVHQHYSAGATWFSLCSVFLPGHVDESNNDREMELFSSEVWGRAGAARPAQVTLVLRGLRVPVCRQPSACVLYSGTVLPNQEHLLRKRKSQGSETHSTGRPCPEARNVFVKGRESGLCPGHCHLKLPEQLNSYEKLIYSNKLWIKTQVASVLCQGESVPLGFHRLLANTTLDILKGLERRGFVG